MFLASGGYSKMSGFSAQLFLRSPHAFLEQGEVCHVWECVTGSTCSVARPCFPDRLCSILQYICVSQHYLLQTHSHTQ